MRKVIIIITVFALIISLLATGIVAVVEVQSPSVQKTVSGE